MKVLYVEDDKDIFEPFMNRIEFEFTDENKPTIINSRSREDAKEKFENNDFDVLILDMSIPDTKSDLELNKGPNTYGGLDLLRDLVKTDHYKKVNPKIYICSAVDEAIQAANRSDLQAEIIHEDIIIEKGKESAKKICNELKKLLEDDSHYPKLAVKRKFNDIQTFYDSYQESDLGTNFINLMHAADNNPPMRNWITDYWQFLNDTLIMFSNKLFKPPIKYVDNFSKERYIYTNGKIKVAAYIDYLKFNENLTDVYWAALKSSWNKSNDIKHYYDKNFNEKIKRIETGTLLKILRLELIFVMEFIVKKNQSENTL